MTSHSVEQEKVNLKKIKSHVKYIFKLSLVERPRGNAEFVLHDLGDLCRGEQQIRILFMNIDEFICKKTNSMSCLTFRNKDIFLI